MEPIKFNQDDNFIQDTNPEKHYLMSEEDFLAKQASEKELKALKLWLFTENVRLEDEKRKLQELQILLQKTKI